MALLHSSVDSFGCFLSKCRKERDIIEALRLHDVFMSRRELRIHGPQLVSVLIDLGSMHHARQVFEVMEYKDALSWNRLIVGYTKHGEPEHALSLYQRVQEIESLHLRPSNYAFVALLKACATVKDPIAGRGIHAEAARFGVLKSNAFIGCSLVDMYAKCGNISTAHETFKELPMQDTVSWNALITGYSELGCGKEALKCFAQMRHEGVIADAVTFVCCFKACGSTGDISKGEEIYDEVVRKGLEFYNLICNALVDMYIRVGMLLSAKEIFDKLTSRDVVSYNVFLNGLVEEGHWKEILAMAKHMEDDGIFLDDITYIYLLKACSSVGSSEKGQEIHTQTVIRGLEREPLLGSSLVDMYSKCGLLMEAHRVLLRLPNRGVAAWTALMAGYTEHQRAEELLDCFEHMQSDGISADASAFSCSLKACGSIGDIEIGQVLHTQIVVKGLENDLLVGSTLVNMYANLGLLITAQRVSDELSTHDMLSLNALIVGYSKKGCGKEALRCFDQMQQWSISMNPVTVACALKACCIIGSIRKGIQIHVTIVLMGMEQDQLIGNALINFYAKFSLLKESQETFNELFKKDLISWTTLIGAYAQKGLAQDVLSIFVRMKEAAMIPNLVTLVHLLTACNRGGLMTHGQSYFEAISKDYGFVPGMYHYTCIIDLLGRAGHTDKAITMLQKMPMQPDLVLWHAVLRACYKWANVELGRFSFENAVRLDERDAAAYLYMCAIYRIVGMYKEADKIEAMRRENQAWA